MENLEDKTRDNSNKEDFKINLREPKRIIYCSDGAVEEYSDDDNNEVSEQITIDPKTLNWLQWIKYQAEAGGNKALEYCDYVGEGLADFLGITTPKYQLEISEYERIEASKKKLKEESAGWIINQNENGTPLVTLQPVLNNIDKIPTSV